MTPDYHYLDKLNDQQRAAVTYMDGPSLVIAGAGSGKTRVLTYKVVHLLNCGYEPYRILALTFTNKAAREMKQRIEALTGPATASRIWMGTFHSIFLKILRRHAELIGYNSSFSIYDTADSRNLVKLIIKDFGLNDKDYKPNTIASTISNAKNAMMTPEQYEAQYQRADTNARRPMTSQIFKEYVRRCRRANAMDFDDIIFYMNILLRDNDDIREKYSNHFRYILVDEYQDTNFAQHTVIRQLTGPDNRVCVVGDDAQSIYSFRGANINNIINLKQVYKGLEIFKLERNYRSTQNIVNASGSLISKNTHQMQKQVYSENDKGCPVEIIQTYSDLEEANMVAAKIEQSVLTEHDSYEDYAILYRTNAQSRVLEEALRKRAMPYRIYGGTAFYQRKEVKDAVAYFRVVVNPDDDEALRRIINYPARGIGETTMKKIQAAASIANVSLWKVISDPEKYNLDVNSGTRRKLDSFATMIDLFIEDNKHSDAYEVGQLVFNRTGLLAMFAYDNAPESISRQENLKELLAGMNEFVETRRETGEEDLSLRTFLSEVMLATDQDEADAVDGAKVTLMTAHAAKGLEFKHVYIVGVEEELFPSAMAMDSMWQVEEERRLLYVAMTRAMVSCTMSYAKQRFRNGQTINTSPSRFLSDIDTKYVDYGSTGRPTAYVNKPFADTYPNRNGLYSDTPGKPRTSLAGHSNPPLSRLKRVEAVKKDNIPTYAASDLRPGTRIEHKKFGIGTVIDTGQLSGMDSVTVDFGVMGTKKLLLGFAKFSILPEEN